MSKHAPRSHSGLSRSSLCRAIATCLLAGAMLPAMAQDAAPEEDPGQVGDAASWRTDEFMADWGLGAIGAEYAYARGLTGHGIRLGVFDSGVALDHAEFAGGDPVLDARVGQHVAGDLLDDELVVCDVAVDRVDLAFEVLRLVQQPSGRGRERRRCRSPRPWRPWS